MGNVLFDGKKDVSNQEVIQKMNYFMEKAEQGMKLHGFDKKKSLILAKELRNELDNEYKSNDLVRTSNFYDNHVLFVGYYRPAVHEALVSVTGAMSYDKLYSFLYNVKDYMRYYMPNKYEE